MKRDYSSGESTDVTYFIGTEIERTPAYGMRTLFVVGVQRVTDVIELCEFHKCEHIYLGANHSFEPTEAFDTFMTAVGESGILVTVDFDVKHVEWMCESRVVEMNNVIPQVSVKIPYADQLGYNATLKIDDKDFNASNAGVWCHQLRELQTRDKFTHWSEYGKDEIIE